MGTLPGMTQLQDSTQAHTITVALDPVEYAKIAAEAEKHEVTVEQFASEKLAGRKHTKTK